MDEILNLINGLWVIITIYQYEIGKNMGIHYKNVAEWDINKICISYNHPLVYLDTWAINYYCSDIDEGKIFVKIMTDKKATLAISDINIKEIGQRKDTNQIEKICNFLQTFDIALISTNHLEVIDKEIQKEKGNSSIIPWDSDYLIKFYQKFLLSSKSNSLQPFSVCKLIKKHHEKENESPLNNCFEKVVNPLLKKVRNDDSSVSKAKKEFEKLKKQVANEHKPITKLVSELVARYLIMNKNKMPESEWCDVQHLIVPVSYCDFILLDKVWIAFLKQAELKHPKIAKSYSKGQISDFHNDLMSHT